MGDRLHACSALGSRVQLPRLLLLALAACTACCSACSWRPSTQPHPPHGSPPPPRGAGGPGFEAARPTELGGWVKQASAYFRVVLLVGAGAGAVWLGAGQGCRCRSACSPPCRTLHPPLHPPALAVQDQRGTGRSSAITPDNLAARGSPEQQAAYLKFFRCGDQFFRWFQMGAGAPGGQWVLAGSRTRCAAAAACMRVAQKPRGSAACPLQPLAPNALCPLAPQS